jgi:hypothetical protein
LNVKSKSGIVAKNAKNPHFKNTYADINALISAVEPILLENGLVLLQPIVDGKQYTEIHDVDTGEAISSFLELNTTLPSQAMGSQITYFRRYTLQSLLSLQADDDDANSASQVTQKVNLVKPNFTSVQFQRAYEAGATIDDIKTKYNLSKELEKSYNLFLSAKQTINERK